MPSTWGATASNGLITFDALVDAATNGVFDTRVPISSIPTGKEIVTKADAESYVLIDSASSPWSGYDSNRCPPKSAFNPSNYCAIVSISISDILSATGNTIYPDGTVYVRTASGTTSYTSPGEYPVCTRPDSNVPSSEYIYYYANDSIQFFVVSTINFYPSSVSCSTSGCAPSGYVTKYDAFTCAGCTGGGTNVTLYVPSAPTWSVGTLVSGTAVGQTNVGTGRYVYAGKCYYVETAYRIYYSKGNPFYQATDSRILSVTNC